VNWGAILTVLGKELRETLRDRRTLMVMIVVPVLLYPAMLIIMEQITIFGQRTLAADAVRVTLVRPTAEAVRFLDADPAISTSTADGPHREALRRDNTDAILVFPETWSETAANEVELLFDATRDRSGHARMVVERRLREWIDTLRVARLEERGLPEGFATPLQVEQTSIATPQAVGGYLLGRFLPLLLIMMTTLGAFYPSIDLAAGEKERGTLEPLLTVPVHADNLVIGKFAAAALMGLTAATLNLGSMLLTFQAGIVQFAALSEMQFQLPASAVLVIFGVLALLAVLFSSLFLGIAVRSHSFKEAQNALTPVYMLGFVPAIVPLIPGLDFSFGMAVIPVAGVAFLFRDLMGGTAELGPSMVAVAATMLYAALALGFAARSFGREEVLFGTGAGDPGNARGRRVRGSTLNRLPTPAAALIFVAAVAVIFFYGARPLALSHGETGLMLAQVFFLAAPALLFVLLGRFAAAETLAIRAPSSRALAAGMLIMLGGIPIGWLIAWLQSFVLEIPYEFLEALQQMIMAEDRRRLLWMLLVVALTPAICEELVFRGVLLNGLRSRLGMIAAVIGSAAIFAAFHLSFETAVRFLPTFWLGLLLAYVAWNTRSIFPAMLMHFVNNGVVVVLVSTTALRESFADPTGQPPWLLVLVAPLLLVLGVRMLRHEASTTTTGRPRPATLHEDIAVPRTRD
jgi:sodium transport system permease protein